jgi:[acyl-carrier-protein] S-malonyltransferase
MNLFNHAAFHTPLLDEISQKAKSTLPQTLFNAPNVPLVDGLGKIWQPYSCEPKALYEYTLGAQVVDTYDFTKAIEVAIKEFAPDKLIILGPGATLGGAVAQSLIQQNWLGMESKKDFISLQKTDPFILAMGLEEQRKEVI